MAKKESYRRRRKATKRIGLTNTRNLALSKRSKRNGIVL